MICDERELVLEFELELELELGLGIEFELELELLFELDFELGLRQKFECNSTQLLHCQCLGILRSFCRFRAFFKQNVCMYVWMENRQEKEETSRAHSWRKGRNIIHMST